MSQLQVATTKQAKCADKQRLDIQVVGVPTNGWFLSYLYVKNERLYMISNIIRDMRGITFKRIFVSLVG